MDIKDEVTLKVLWALKAEIQNEINRVEADETLHATARNGSLGALKRVDATLVSKITTLLVKAVAE